MNLNKVRKFANEYPQLPEEDRAVVGQRVERLLAYIEQQPKTLKWKMRAKVLTKTM